MQVDSSSLADSLAQPRLSLSKYLFSPHSEYYRGPLLTFKPEECEAEDGKDLVLKDALEHA